MQVNFFADKKMKGLVSTGYETDLFLSFKINLKINQILLALIPNCLPKAIYLIIG